MSSRSASSSGRSSAQAGNWKRLIVCCDGTWVDSDSSLQDGKIPPPSNVTRITRAIKSQSSDGIQQIVYYQAGVGSMGTLSNKLVQGISGEGLAEHVREAYTFIANNWNPGDEIFLIGFSRGAFTARSIGGVICNIGVMTRAGLPAFQVVYQDYAHRYRRRYQSPLPNVPFPNKPPFRDPDYAREMERRGLTTLNVNIKAIGVWETVGSLGVPRIGWLGALSERLSAGLSDYSFYDTMLDDKIQNAFQALALDEKRASFQPCVWEKRDDSETNLVQVWFPGVHTNVGGGYNDQELANNTLAWMMSMLEPLISMDTDYILVQDRVNIEYYKSKRAKVRPWSFGKIYDSESLTSGFKFGGAIVRTPGDYCRINPATGQATDEPLLNTNEYIHASARSRYVLEGPGYADKGKYISKALDEYRVRYEDVGLATPWFWQLHGDDPLILPEAPLRPIERKLLRGSPDVDEYVTSPPGRQQSKGR